MTVQYWRSFEQLHAYATPAIRSTCPHGPRSTVKSAATAPSASFTKLMR
jgi:hypothetical protein